MSEHNLFEVHHHGDVTEIRFIASELSDLVIHDSLSRALDALLDDERLDRVVVNLEAVEYCTSGVIGSLLSFKKSVQSRGGTIRLTGINGNVLESFESLNLIGAVFEVDGSVTEAMDKF